jgi:uncharacterized membrane protein HdeD (DUF308 family)
MLKPNESTTDRILRVVAGVLLLALALLNVVSGTLNVIFIVIGIVLLVTGVTGFCPLYALLKIRTNKA